MIKIGLVGMPKSGKTTIFNAVTHSNAEVSDYYTGKIKPNIAMVNVKDERLDYLNDIFQREKKVYIQIQYIDFIGMKKDEAKKEIFTNQLLGILRTVDSLGIVARGFNIPGSKLDPLNEIEIIQTEFIFSDLTICEKKLETFKQQFKRGVKSPELMKEKEIIERCYSSLSIGKSLRVIDLKSHEKDILRGYQFLSLKPIFVILNVSEDTFGSNEKIIKSIKNQYLAVEVAGKFEMELNQLDQEDAKQFMDEYNIKESALNKLTALSYKTLDLISFFTIGKNEVRAWSIFNNSTVFDAANEIHTDIAKGFIRAEKYSIVDLKKYGSEKNLKEAGKFYLEGKECLIKDGDIIYIRHN